jgi:hypothetical protein
VIKSLPAKLSFFQPDIVEDTIENSLLDEHYPVGFNKDNLDDPIKFDIRGTDRWMDLENAYFSIEAEIIGKDNTATDAPTDASHTAKLYIVNNFFASLFPLVRVSLNNSTTTFNNEHYNYIDYIQKLLNYNSDVQEIHGSLFTWSKDTAGKMDVADDTNKGAKERKTWIQGNKIRGCMKLCSPLFLMKPYLLPFLNLNITMNRIERHDFLFMAPTASDFKCRINKIVLKIRKIKTVTSFTTSIEHMLHKMNEPITYPLTNATVFTKTYSGYGTDIIEENIFHGILPNRIIFGFVDNDAFFGSKSKNPYNFKNKGITEVGIKINGVQFPHQPIRMDFAGNDYHEAYYHFLESLKSITPMTNSVYITPAEYKEGYTLFSFDMSSDQKGGMNHVGLHNEPANVQLHIKFAESKAADIITLVVYYETTSRVLVDSSRQVQVYSK